jgi:hypothetical protein
MVLILLKFVAITGLIAFRRNVIQALCKSPQDII